MLTAVVTIRRSLIDVYKPSKFTSYAGGGHFFTILQPKSNDLLLKYKKFLWALATNVLLLD